MVSCHVVLAQSFPLLSVLIHGLSSFGKAIIGCFGDLGTWIHQCVWARTWFEAVWINAVAILSCITNEWEWFCPTFNASGNGSHPLCCRGTNTTAVIPSIAVARCPAWFAIGCRCCKLSIAG